MFDMVGKTLDWAGRITFAVCGSIILDSVFADGASVFEYVLGGLYFGVAMAYIAALAFQCRWLATMREDMKERRRYGDDQSAVTARLSFLLISFLLRWNL